MISKQPHLILFGFPGSGKTTLARYLSSNYGVPYFDTDELIEKKEGCSRKQMPVAHFRLLETETIASLPLTPPSIISIGGGSLLSSRNQELLFSMGKLLYLHLDYRLLKERWKTGAIPSFVKNQEEFYNERLLHYQTFAAVRLDMTRLSLEEAAKQALFTWGTHGQQYLRSSL